MYNTLVGYVSGISDSDGEHSTAHETRASVRSCKVPCVNSEARNAFFFFYTGIILWNSLPLNIKMGF